MTRPMPRCHVTPFARSRDWPTVAAVDFDGVLHRYENWETDGPACPNEPLPGARMLLAGLASRFARVYVMTARSDLNPVKLWLIKHRLDEFVWGVTNTKVPADVYIDDRALFFPPNGDVGAVDDILTTLDLEWAQGVYAGQ